MKLSEIKKAAIKARKANGEILHVVQISGGKDSQASGKLTRAKYPDAKIIGLFCDTKFEHDYTYAHILKICELYKLELVVLNEGSVASKVLQHKRYPSDNARFCTSELKIKPAKKWLIEQAVLGYNVINYIGVRSDESTQRTKRYGNMNDEYMTPNEFLPSQYPKYMGNELAIKYCLPIVEWSEKDVFDYLQGEHNPLYDAGFSSVGCFPCMAGGDKWKHKAFNFDHIGKKHYEQMKALEPFVLSNNHYPIFTSAKGKKEECEKSQNGCAFCSI